LEDGGGVAGLSGQRVFGAGDRAAASDVCISASQPGNRTVTAARTWEYAYVAGASAAVLIMGSWSFIALVATSDPYAHLVSFSMTIAFLLSVFGRNFGSGKFVVVQILCAWIPLSAALLISGDIFYITFAILPAPFFLTLKFISDHFRNSLLDAIAATHQATAVAQRFDTALTNMPHGLCMLDGQGRILVANERFVELLNLGKALDVCGWRIERLLRRCVRQGGLARGCAPRPPIARNGRCVDGR
jgi:PAS domain-containing protein